MASAVVGTMIDPRIMPNSSRLPANSYFAKPYPASVARMAAPPAATTEYRAELSIQRTKTPLL